jgi:hypothetical protein
VATGHLEKRSKRGWTIVINYGRQFDPATGKYKQKREFKALKQATKAEAEAMMHEMLAQINKGAYVKPTDVTLAQAILAGLVGYLAVYLLRALGHKHLAGMLRVMSVVLVVSGLIHAAAQAIAGLKQTPIAEAFTWILERVR